MFLCNTNDRTLKILKMAGVDKIIKSIECDSFSGRSEDKNTPYDNTQE